MLNVYDVAYTILQFLEKPISVNKLQKLLYYCQSWHVAWEQKFLFAPEILRASPYGPYVAEIKFIFRDEFFASKEPLEKYRSCTELNPDDEESVLVVLEEYAKLNPQELNYLIFKEKPFMNALENPDSNIITIQSLIDYYQQNQKGDLT